MTGLCEVVITAPDTAWLLVLARRLVDERLCASGQTIEHIRSIYRWRGEVNDVHEARVALRTREDLVPAITQRVRDEHPYEVPSIVALPILGGNPDYLQWIRDETRSPAPTRTEQT